MMKANPASGHSSSISPLSPLDAESTTSIKVSGSVVPKNLDADLPPIPTRTHKKRLSFASISSFFGTRSLQERRAKQPRSSSVPHVENPLAIVGRQIAGFQRRHSLNELHESPKPKENQLSVHQLVSPSWEEGCIATSSQSTSTAGAPPQVPAKKLSLNGVFSKQKKKGSSAPPAPLPPKPLKSALVQRPTAPSTTTKVHPVHNAVTRRRSASVRSQTSSHRRRHSVHRHQQPRQRQRPNSDDPFARLAEANQALASLSRHDSRSEANDYGVVALDDDDFCTSPLSYEDLGPVFLDQIHPHDPQSPTRPATKEMTPPKPRVLPVTTRENSSSAKTPQFGSSPCNSPKQNPLSTLTGSPSSSHCSYSSGSGHGETGFDVYHSRTSSVSDGSCASSACSIRFDDSVTTSSDRTSVTATPTAVFNALLPASAARISVDRIAMESLMARQGQTFGAEYYEHPMTHSIHPMAVPGYPKQEQWPQQQEQQPSVADPPYLADDYNLEIQYHYPHECYNVDPRRQRRLQFSIEEPTIHHTWTPDQYDRTSDPNITASRLTPAIAHKIKLELNHFKSQEMEIHQDSRKYTHYFI
ncbi:hypothetical protein BGX34_000171 [Mortierella sp. NVP85]|nr:hypothetical protein BGX34_000171 [Mortierella sp. NVP85]